MLNISYKILNPLVKEAPSYATLGSAGVDLSACINEDVILSPGQTFLCPTGLAIYIKDPGFAGIILPRSGLGTKSGIILANTVGLIDSDYQGELKIALYNRSSVDFKITPMMRVAQLTFMRVEQANFIQVESFEETVRGSGGFGSTGL